MMYLNHPPSTESNNGDTIYTQPQPQQQQQQQQNLFLLQQHFALQQEQHQQPPPPQQLPPPPPPQHQSPPPQQFQEPLFELKLEPDQYFDPSQSFLVQPLLPVSPVESPIRDPSYYSPPQKSKSFSSSFVPSPPASPMASPLGSPNRSCASCKKRKVKCDRKTPSCSACSKSKLQCYYTSYSPPTFVERQTMTITDQPQNRPTEQLYEPEEEESDIIRSLRQQLERVEREGRERWERVQKMVAELKASQQQFARITSQYIPLQSQDPTFSFLLPDDDAAMLKLSVLNPKPASPPPVAIKTSPSLVMRNKTNPGAPSYGFNPYPTHNIRQQNSASPVFFPPQQPELASTNFTYSTNTSTHIFHPYKKARITFNYNLAGFRPLLVRAIFPILRSMTSGAAARLFPPDGFTDAAHVQSWLRSTFLALVYEDLELHAIFDPKVEKLQLSSLDDTSATGILTYQKFDLVLSRVFREQQQSSSSGQINNGYGETDQTETGKHGSHNAQSNDPSSLDDQAFLDKVNAIIQLFVKEIPWIRENYLVGVLNDGIFSDVIIEVFGDSSEKELATTESLAADSDGTIGINDDIVVKRGRYFL